MGYEVWGRAPAEGRAQAASVRPGLLGGYWGRLSTFTIEGEELVQRVTEEARERADETEAHTGTSTSSRGGTPGHSRAGNGCAATGQTVGKSESFENENAPC